MDVTMDIGLGCPAEAGQALQHRQYLSPLCITELSNQNNKTQSFPGRENLLSQSKALHEFT
jgi:hypothetical protein